MTYDWVPIILTVAICGVIPLAGLVYFIYDTITGPKIPSGDDRGAR